MSWLLAALNTFAAFISLFSFLNFIFENAFVVLAYFTLLIEVSETFGAMMVTAILTNFIILLISTAHSFNVSGFSTAALPQPQLSSLSLVSKFSFILYQTTN